ncbi:hypothetical protein BsWGS_23692 [Bradybaena similaris]
MSTMMKTSILLLVAVILGSTDAQNYSKKTWGFLATFNGEFSNMERVRKGFTNHTTIRSIAKPVAVPAMGQGPMMLLEVGERHLIEFRQLFVLSDGEDNVVMLTPYNFTGCNNYSFGEFDSDVLSNLTKDDFWTDPDCVIGMEMIDSGFFFGDWPVCTTVADGTHPAWGCSFTCNHISLTIPMEGDEVRNSIPYYLNRIGPKFPIINPPSNYVNPCDIQCLCDKC